MVKKGVLGFLCTRTFTRLKDAALSCAEKCGFLDAALAQLRTSAVVFS
jgi:hypothetical protein